MLKKIITFVMILSMFAGVCSCAKAPRPQSQITDVVQTEDNTYKCQFEGMSFKFMLFLPEKVDGNTSLILMMNGLYDNCSGFKNHTHMDETACARGYAVCFVQPGDGTGGKGWDCGLWNTNEVDSLDYLVNLVIYLQDEYGLSKTKAFAAGFSNGGFMAHRVAMEASDTFLAVTSVAGVMTTTIWDERVDKTSIGVLEIYGTNDSIFQQDGTAEVFPYQPIDEVMEYWAQANGLSASGTEQLSDKAEITKYTAFLNKTQVWTVKIEDGAHEWPPEDKAGFNTNELILDFFDQCS
ncbi:MAG: prolyl oligopeptidase family serine peptidase [Clostridiales bacterium]|nr:prolyl oligopeptidase family serine peptidase [Clostridiales bacterium]